LLQFSHNRNLDLWNSSYLTGKTFLTYRVALHRTANSVDPYYAIEKQEIRDSFFSFNELQIIPKIKNPAKQQKIKIEVTGSRFINDKRDFKLVKYCFKSIKCCFKSVKCCFKSVKCCFESVKCCFESVKCCFESIKCCFESIKCCFESIKCCFELVKCCFELVECCFELVECCFKIIESAFPAHNLTFCEILFIFEPNAPGKTKSSLTKD
jgi:hypothetical protein